MTTEIQAATPTTPTPPTEATIQNKSGSVKLDDFFNPQHPLGGTNGLQEGQEKAHETKEVKPEAAAPAVATTPGEEAEDGEAEAGEEETKKAEAKPDATPPPIKTYKFKAGDKEVELTEDSEILIPVDGKEQKVTLKDLRANWSGVMFHRQKLTEVDKQRKAVEAEKATVIQEKQKFLSEKETIDKALGKVMGLIKNKNIYGAVDVLARMAKRDRNEVLRDIVTQSEALAKEMGELTPEQKEALFRQKATEFKAQELEEERKVVVSQKEDLELQAYTRDLQVRNGISNEELAHGWEVIQKAGLPENLSAKQIADRVVGYVKSERQVMKVANAVAKVDPKLTQGDEGRNFLGKLLPLVEDDFTEQDIIEIVREAVGVPAKKSVQVAPTEEPAKDASEDNATPKRDAKPPAKPSRSPSKQEKPKTGEEKRAYLRFDDILEEYR